MTSFDLFQEIGGLDPELVLQAAPDAVQIIPFTKRPAFKRLMACAAALVLLIGVLSASPVSAAVRKLFSFTPGIGIQPVESAPFYAMEPITGYVESGQATAEIWQASYSKGTFYATVVVTGKPVYHNGFAFTRNAEAVDLMSDPQHTTLSVSIDSTMLSVTLPMEAPAEGDRFEFQIIGFEEPLVFTMKPCRTYENLCEIGPTVEHNGISLTVTAKRTGNELALWCYDTRSDTATTDQLVGIGRPANCGHSVIRYIKTQSGELRDKSAGWTLMNRMEFQLAYTDQTATLHIPYLAMLRQESGVLTVPLSAYGKTETDIVLDTSLGAIRIVSMERTAWKDGKDILRLQLAYDRKTENQQLYSFEFQLKNADFSFRTPNKDGYIEYIEMTVPEDTQTVEIVISDLYYYLTDEYVIDLDIG